MFKIAETINAYLMKNDKFIIRKLFKFIKEEELVF